MKTLMKKLFLLFTVLCAAVALQAQVISGYQFAASQGTYTEITDGTVVNTTGVGDSFRYLGFFPDSIINDVSATLPGFPIGFEFTYNDIICNQFAIGSSGVISLGRDSVNLKADETGWIMTREYEGEAVNVIGVATKETQPMLATTQLSYKVMGEAPNRVLVVQFKDMPYGLDYSGDNVGAINTQIKLYETTNRVEIVFGDVIVPEDQVETTRDFRVGLHGTGSDRLIVSRPDYDEEYTLDQYKAFPEGSSAISICKTNLPKGLTYTFDQAPDCVAPAQEYNLTGVNVMSTEFSLEWKPLVEADRMLVVLYTVDNLGDAPQNGVFYNEGDSIGNGRVLAFTTDTIYTLDYSIKLETSTQYYLYLCTANTFCAGGPIYDTGAITSFTTKPAAPQALAITSTGLNSLTFDVTGNGTDDVFVILTDSVRENRPYANVIEFGTPTGEYQVGDLVEGLGRVVYMGPSAQNVVVEGLEASTGYYLRAHSYGASGYSSDVLEDKDATIITLPWCPDLSKEDRNGLPAGWTAGGHVAGTCHEKSLT